MSKANLRLGEAPSIFMNPIVLCPWDDAVAPDLFLALRSDDVYRFIPAFAPESALQFCARHRLDGVGADLVLSVHLNEANRPAIGLVSVRIEDATNCELGFMLAPEHWGKGFGKTIVALTLPEIRKTLGARTVIAKVDSRNTASIRSLEANGFFETARIETMLKFEASVDVVLTCAV